ncbi:MAG: AAA family ATPase [Candidatus Melainabacteria bacterium]|nr:AAA family ATPase [Candidatus Melainabacteria bacterium]
MLIRRIEIKNFRRLIGPVVIDGLKEGINVIAGDNEEGKSTLLHALQAALFQRHNSTSQQVRDFMPYNCMVRPEVSVHFELDSKKYSIQKGFCTKPYLAEFCSPTGTFQGAEAEEKVRELFKLPVKGKKVGESDPGLWGLLWLEQDSASKGLGTTEGGKESLMKVLESDLSDVLGGQAGRALLKQISFQHSQYFTPSTNKEKGDYKEARDRSSSVSQQYDECRTKHEQYKRKLIELAERQDALAKHQREKTLENAKAEVEQAALEVTRIEKLALEVDASKQAERSALLEYQNLKGKFDTRTELSARKLVLETALAAQEAAIKTAQAEVDQSQKALEVLRSDYLAAEAALQSAAIECQRAEKREELTKLLSARAALAKQIQSVEELQIQLESDTASAAKISIDQNSLQALRSLETQKNEAETRADMTATKLVLRPSGSNEALIGNEKIASEEISLTEKTTINFKDWGELDVMPGGEDIAERVRSAESKRSELLSALAKLGVATVEEAQELWDKRKQFLNDIASVKQQIVTICGIDRPEVLKKNFQKLDEDIKSRGDNSGEEAAPPAGELSELRIVRDKAQQSEKASKTAYEAGKELLSKKTAEITKLGLEKNTTITSLSEVTAQLKELCAEDLDKQRATLVEAEQKHSTARTETERKVLELTQANPEEKKSKHVQCKTKCTQIEAVINKLNTEKITLTADINAEGKAGLGEELERLQGEKELAESHFKRVERKALALKLLNQVLTNAESEAKDQFLEPVLAKLNPHLQTVFPGAQLILDNQDVEISRLKRNGVEENYTSLSVGTREQLSVLMRLSIAGLMKEKGQPCVVVLDDALVYSDDGRIAKMKKVLQTVAADMQVIVLTCRLRDYTDLAGANILHLHETPKKLTKAKPATPSSPTTQLNLFG